MSATLVIQTTTLYYYLLAELIRAELFTRSLVPELCIFFGLCREPILSYWSQTVSSFQVDVALIHFISSENHLISILRQIHFLRGYFIDHLCNQVVNCMSFQILLHTCGSSTSLNWFHCTGTVCIVHCPRCYFIMIFLQLPIGIRCSTDAVLGPHCVDLLALF